MLGDESFGLTCRQFAFIMKIEILSSVAVESKIQRNRLDPYIYWVSTGFAIMRIPAGRLA